MKVEIPYFPGCPNHPPALGWVREALAQEGVSAEVVEVEANDPAKARLMGFLGRRAFALTVRMSSHRRVP